MNRVKTVRTQLVELVETADSIDDAITKLKKFLDNKEIYILDLISKGTYEEAMKADPITNAEMWRDKPWNKENAKL